MKTSCIVWGDEVRRTADDALRDDETREGTKFEKCKNALRELLRLKPMGLAEIKEKLEGIAGEDTVRRALREVAAVDKEKKRAGKSFWVLKRKVNDNRH